MRVLAVMRELKSENEFAEMLAQNNAALFVFVDWSEYAKRGLVVFKEAEADFISTTSNSAFSWWSVDISSGDSPPNPALHGWLTSQQQEGKVRVFPNIAVGAGSVVWLKQGEIIGFDMNAERLGQEALVRRAHEIVATS